jgi:PTH1 family peptidyl-tRNA hydrolase
MKVIFAQGNPEPDYANTRHNIGFSILNEMAEKLDLKWTNNSKFSAHIADTIISGEKMLLVKPTTFYNETGNSIRKIIDFYKLAPETDLLIVHDDLALPFGTIRIRGEGSDGGNNGIKSINDYIDSNYSRIRIGTNNDMRSKMNNDAEFVTAKFSKDEMEQLQDAVIPQVIKLIHKFCLNKLEVTSHKLI